MKIAHISSSSRFAREFCLRRHVNSVHLKARTFPCRYEGCRSSKEAFVDSWERCKHERAEHGEIFSAKRKEELAAIWEASVGAE